jgi:hypothetical protein
MDTANAPIIVRKFRGVLWRISLEIHLICQCPLMVGAGNNELG